MPLSSGPGLQFRKGGKQLFVFDLNVLDNSTRKVYGKATGPQLDRENETILKAAIEDALPNFMQLPIMHLDHTERPVGWFTKAEFQGQDLFVEARIKPTSDCDALWADVVRASKAGKPYQFSIYGDRKVASKSCSLSVDDPRRKTNPCITKSLELYSISICQPGTAINPNTFADVVKAWDSASTNLIHPVTDGKYPKKGSRMAFPPKKEEENTKEAPPAEESPQEPIRETDNGPAPDEEQPGESEGGGGMKEVIDLLTQIVQRLQTLESSLGLQKSEVTEENMEEKKPDEPEKCAKKAEVPAVEPKEDTTFSKANLDRITKAEAEIGTMKTQITELAGKVDTLMKSTAQKTETLVIDPEAIKKADTQGRYNVEKLARILG